MCKKSLNNKDKLSGTVDKPLFLKSEKVGSDHVR